MGTVIRKVQALSVKLNELIGKSTKHSSFETSIPYFAIPFESNILFGELVCKLTMATCSFPSLFHLTSPCGASSKDPQDFQCVTLRECNKDVHPHLKSLKVGPDEEISDEMALLLARAGTVSRLTVKKEIFS